MEESSSKKWPQEILFDNARVGECTRKIAATVWDYIEQEDLLMGGKKVYAQDGQLFSVEYVKKTDVATPATVREQTWNGVAPGGRALTALDMLQTINDAVSLYKVVRGGERRHFEVNESRARAIVAAMVDTKTPGIQAEIQPVNTPVFRFDSDGSPRLITEPGFHGRHFIYCDKSPRRWEIPSGSITREELDAARDYFTETLNPSPVIRFVEESEGHGLASWFAWCLTCLTRDSYGPAPIAYFSASSTMAGKSLLMDAAWRLVGGRYVVSCGAPPDDDQVVAMLPQRYLSFDNADQFDGGRNLLETIASGGRTQVRSKYSATSGASRRILVAFSGLDMRASAGMMRRRIQIELERNTDVTESAMSRWAAEWINTISVCREGLVEAAYTIILYCLQNESQVCEWAGIKRADFRGLSLCHEWNRLVGIPVLFLTGKDIGLVQLSDAGRDAVTELKDAALVAISSAISKDFNAKNEFTEHDIISLIDSQRSSGVYTIKNAICDYAQAKAGSRGRPNIRTEAPVTPGMIKPLLAEWSTSMAVGMGPRLVKVKDTTVRVDGGRHARATRYTIETPQ